MILNADAKSLEIYCAAYLSQDSVMMRELINGLDMHEANQKAFGLPSRLIAKVLNFRILYGGSGYSFSKDPDFTTVSTNEKFWNTKIEKYYEKYKGLRNWHQQLVQEVTRTSKLIMPTGRVYEYKKTQRGDWPVTTIKNYPVQGLGADLMSIARASFFKRFKEAKINGVLVNTVHDSIVVDCDQSEILRVTKMFHEVFNDVPANFKKIFGVEFNLPLFCEVSYGPNQKDLEEIQV